MSDPIRWRASDGAPDGVRDLLRHARAPKALDAVTRARHATSVAKIAAGAAPAVAVGAKAALGAKLLLGVGLAATVAVTAVPSVRDRVLHDRPAAVARAHRPPPPLPAAPAPTEVVAAPVAVTAPAEAPAAVTAVTAPEAPSPAPLPVAAVAAVAPTRPVVTRAPVVGHTLGSPVAAPVVAAPQPAVAAAAPETTGATGASTGLGAGATPAIEDSLAREQRLLEGAAALVAGDPRGALTLLDRHEREFPDGQAAADREWMAVQALHNLGRTSEMRARGEALIARYPGCPYVSRTRRMLDALP